jgi:HSP20 family protein
MLGPFSSLHREIDRLFDDFVRGFGTLAGQIPADVVPSIDVVETEKDIEITAELPGLERKDVEITLEGDTLTIRGEKRSETRQPSERGEQGQQVQGDQAGNGQNKRVHLAERNYGVFYRVLAVPAGVDPSTIEATMSNGILKIRIPKSEHSEARKIEVKEAA